MLCDDVVEFYRKDKLAIASYQRDRENMLSFLSKLEKAKKFFLSKETVELCSAFNHDNPKATYEARDFARPPFALTWIEFNVDKKPSELDDIRSDISKTDFPNKMGFLIEDDGGGNFSIYMAYKTGRLCSINFACSTYRKNEEGVMAKVFAALKKHPLREELVRELGDATAMQEKYIDYCDKVSERMRSLGKNNFDAAVAFEKQFSILPAPFYSKTILELMENMPMSSAKDFTLNLHADWAGEPRFVFCFLLFLNTKNAFSVNQFNQPEKLNKARIRAGKQPLSDYSIIDLRDDVKERLKEARELSGEQKRLHWRRGHFKRRATGIFWWMPHLAGSAEKGFVDGQYLT